MNIRPAILLDAPRISALIQGLNAFVTVSGTGEGADEYLDSVSTAAIQNYILADNIIYFVAETAANTDTNTRTEPALAGVVALRDNKHLFHLFIARQYHKTGLARKLWSQVRDIAQATGNHSGFTVNASLSAIPVYEHFGFRANGEKTTSDGVAFLPMALALDDQPHCATQAAT